MLSNTAPPYRIERQAFNRYMRQLKTSRAKAGKSNSLRALEDHFGLSYELIRQVINGRDSKGKVKTHVNMETARQFEAGFGDVPGEIIFLADVSAVSTHSEQAA